MNNSGQVAVLVSTTEDGTPVIVRIDDSGITEIAVQTTEFIISSGPSINNSGRVAFSALTCPEPTSCTSSVFSGTGGSLTEEGARPAGGGGSVPFINNNGLVLDSGFLPLIYTAQGGVVNTLIFGDEDPLFCGLGQQPSHNDFGEFVFGSAACGASDFGLFTGNDPSQHTVVRKNANVFGGMAGGISTALHHTNNLGQIVFLLTVLDGNQNPTIHIVLAEPDLEPPDTSITSGPSGTITVNNATFTWTGTDNLTPTLNLVYAYRLDPIEPGFSAFCDDEVLHDLPNGSYTFFVAAKDAVGNEDQTADSRSFTVTTPIPDITVTPTSLDFGAVAIGDKSVDKVVTVKNDGTANLTITAISLSGTNSDQFERRSDKCSKKTLAPGGSCTVAVRFKPTTSGGKTANLIIPSNDPDENPVNVTLSGSSEAAAEHLT
jgi:hypothetical protein